MIDVNHTAMTLTNCSRKRERSDETEYLPVTKRMNNLHLDGVISANEVQDYSAAQNQMNSIETRLETNYNYNHGNGSHHNQTHTETHNTYSNKCYSDSQRYSPELDSNQNPVYYEANKILYEAHIQRMLRTTNVTKSIFYRKN